MGFVLFKEKSGELTHSFLHARIQEKSAFATQERALTRTPPHWHPDLRLLASRKDTQFMVFCYRGPN